MSVLKRQLQPFTFHVTVTYEPNMKYYAYELKVNGEGLAGKNYTH